MKQNFPNLQAPATQLADLVLQNGNIFTVDARRPRVQAVAIRGETIAAVGSDAEMKPWIGPETRVIDLHGAFAMPGFNDAHVHLLSAGLAKLEIDLQGAKSLAEFQQRVRGALKDYKPGEWITGRGWDHTLWPEKKFPTRQDLDAVAADRPMFFGRVDGHVAIVNSLALKISGITKDTPDPPAGHIVRDPATGEPTGMLEEDSAQSLVLRHIPSPGPARLRRAIEIALADAAEHGVTSLQDNSISGENSWGVFVLYQQLQSEGKLTARITEWLPFEAPLEKLEEMRKRGGTSDAWLKTGALKGFLDGSLGSRTAALLAPYSDDPSTSGILRMDPYETQLQAIERDAAGFQINFHAIGDRANHVALDVFEAVRSANGIRDRRDRIEHAQILASADIPRFVELDVIASVQPSHLLDDERWVDARIGADRVAGAYAWNTLEKSGAHLAFGTDFPVEPINPMLNLYACVTRELPEGGPTGGWQPQEKISIEDAIRNYTEGSAYAQFEEQRKGRIAVGQFADIVVLSADVTRVPPRDILRTKAELTIVGGRVVFESK
ncbi:MAG: amidohydrolase [Candidatus Acidiferrales bacterium]